MTASFSFIRSEQNYGETASGECAEERFHPLARTSIVPTNGTLLILNGWNVNRKITDIVGADSDPASAVQMLQSRPPRRPTVPIITAPGDGQLFGRNYYWRYRWKNSRTGEVSGLSPLYDEGINVGMETSPGASTYWGATAIHNILNDPPNECDTLELFRNLSDDISVFYLVKAVPAKASDGTSQGTYLLVIDDFTDDQIVANETADLSPGPDWAEGLMPPLAKAYVHPTGRVWYYGLVRWGLFRDDTATVSVTAGSDQVTFAGGANTPTIMEPGRMGQRLRLLSETGSGTQIADNSDYRIIQVASSTTWYVYPGIKASTVLPSGVAKTCRFVIEDDRDARSVYMSEPAMPTNVDPSKTIYVGEDFDDAVLHIFSLGGVTHVQTRRRIYRLVNDMTLDPSLSVMVQVAADEGAAGMWCGAATPFGWVYLHERLGVRLFDGTSVRALGSESPFSDFLPKTQFDGVDAASMSDALITYDPTHNLVFFSYIPAGRSVFDEALVFDPEVGTWRGPWRMSLYTAGSLRNVGGDDSYVQGDLFGNLYEPDEQTSDMASSVISGLTTNVANVALLGRLIDFEYTPTASGYAGSTFNGITSGSVRYGSLVTYASNSNMGFGNVELLHVPVADSGAYQQAGTENTCSFGSIRWIATTAYLDAGEPIKPKKIGSVRYRFTRTGSSATFATSVGIDGSSTFVGEQLTQSSSSPTSNTATTTVYAEARLMQTARAFSMKIDGLSTAGDPKITACIVEMEIRSGA